jgi:hypothetical protein
MGLGNKVLIEYTILLVQKEKLAKSSLIFCTVKCYNPSKNGWQLIERSNHSK